MAFNRLHHLPNSKPLQMANASADRPLAPLSKHTVLVHLANLLLAALRLPQGTSAEGATTGRMLGDSTFSCLMPTIATPATGGPGRPCRQHTVNGARRLSASMGLLGGTLASLATTKRVQADDPSTVSLAEHVGAAV